MEIIEEIEERLLNGVDVETISYGGKLFNIKFTFNRGRGVRAKGVRLFAKEALAIADFVNKNKQLFGEQCQSSKPLTA